MSISTYPNLDVGDIRHAETVDQGSLARRCDGSRAAAMMLYCSLAWER